MNKWSRAKYAIQTYYDKGGKFDDGYKIFKQELNKERKNNKDSDEELEGQFASKRQKKDPSNASDYLKQSSSGTNFIRRPQAPIQPRM